MYLIEGAVILVLLYFHDYGIHIKATSYDTTLQIFRLKSFHFLIMYEKYEFPKFLFCMTYVEIYHCF